MGEYLYEKLLEGKLPVLRGHVLLTWRAGAKSSTCKIKQNCRTDLQPYQQYTQMFFFLLPSYQL